MTFRRIWAANAICLGSILFLAACGGKANNNNNANTAHKPVVFAAFATAISEPWDGVIHDALLEAQSAGQIDYHWQDAIGYDQGAMQSALESAIAQYSPDIIFGDAYGNEDVVRQVAAAHADIPFVFGSGGGPVDPNFSVFDNWIHEPAYLCGVIAGMMTSGTVGVVGAMACPEVNRIINAFIAGVHAENAQAQVLVNFINSFYDPATAASAAQAQINAGADLIFAERFIDNNFKVCTDNSVLVFGNMSDQNSLAPDTVVTGPVWDMRPTVQYVISQVSAGAYQAQDLKDFSMMAKGGASLAPFHSFANTLPAAVLDEVQKLSAQIMAGTTRVAIQEEDPATWSGWTAPPQP